MLSLDLATGNSRAGSPGNAVDRLDHLMAETDPLQFDKAKTI